MAKQKQEIKVISYVHTADGLVNFEDLTPEQKRRAATALKIEYMNALYRGKATFTEAKA